MPFNNPKDINNQLPSSRFRYDEVDGKHYVTEIKSGINAEIYKDENNYRARNFQNVKKSTPERLLSIGKAMANWYYYRIVEGK